MRSRNWAGLACQAFYFPNTLSLCFVTTYTHFSIYLSKTHINVVWSVRFWWNVYFYCWNYNSVLWTYTAVYDAARTLTTFGTQIWGAKLKGEGRIVPIILLQLLPKQAKHIARIPFLKCIGFHVKSFLRNKRETKLFTNSSVSRTNTIYVQFGGLKVLH